MDTIFSFFESMTITSDAHYTLFLVTTGATAFLFALGISFLVLAAIDPVRRRLGEMAVGTRLGDGARDSASYSRLSANPDALVPGGDAPSPACPGCADSYGVAARLRAERDDRMSDEFRALGAVDAEHMLAPEPTDDGYRYGGRFPDPPDADADITHDEAAPADAESGIPSVDGSGAPGAEY